MKSKAGKLKTGLVIEGGAMRGIFATGVIDAFMKEKFNPFDMAIGVSAGSTVVAAYLARMFQRNYRIYTDYSLRKEFISVKRFLRGKHLLDLDWLWDITIRDMRLDIPTIMKSKTEFLVGLTDVKTGKAEYLKPRKDNLEAAIKASSALPVLYRDFVMVDGHDYTDGGLSDPIPVRELYRRGARRIMVIRSRPYDHMVSTRQDTFLARIFLRKYPELLRSILDRPLVYNESLEFLRNPPRGTKIIEVNPPKGFRAQRLTRDPSALEEGYKSGFEAGLALVAQW